MFRQFEIVIIFVKSRMSIEGSDEPVNLGDAIRFDEPLDDLIPGAENGAGNKPVSELIILA